MNIITKVLSICIFALVATSCETTSPFYKDFVQTIPPISGDNGRISFYRKDPGFGLSAGRIIFLNNRGLGDSRHLEDQFFFHQKSKRDNRLGF